MAGIKIQQYDQRTSPSSLGVTPTARGERIDASVGQGMQEFAGAMGRATAIYANKQSQIEAERKAAEADTAKVWAGNVAVRAHQDTGQMLIDLQSEVGNGAPDFTKRYSEKFDEYESTALAEAPNEVSRKFLSERFLALRAQSTGAAMQYETAERAKWQVDTVGDSITIAGRVVGADPSKFAIVRAEQRATIEAMSAPPDTKRDLLRKLDSEMATAAVVGEVERDPSLARAKLSDRLGIDAVEAGGGGEASADTTWSRMKHRESRGQQFGKDGKPLTSVKGAIGVAQVMPDTAPIAARYAGLPFDENRYRTDPAYNEALGKAYFDHQLATYKSPALAAAAYNAGPGAVDKWLDAWKKKHGTDPMADAAARRAFAAAIPYKETREYVAAVAPAGRTVAEAAADPATAEIKTGDSPYDLLTTEQAVALLNRTNQAQEKYQAQAKSALAVREADDMAAFGDGKGVPQAITQQEFVDAYGPVEGMRRSETYAQGQRYASAIGQLSSMKPGDIVRTLETYKPQPGAGYRDAAAMHATMQRAAADVIQKRNDDPIAFAANTGLAEVEPLNMSDPRRMGAELKNRAGVAGTMSQDYGARYTLLTNAETVQLTQGMRTMTAPERGQLLQVVRRSLSDPRAYQAVMGQLRADAPVTATAGSLMGMGDAAAVELKSGGMFRDATTITAHQVAQRLLIGDDLLNPTKDAKGEDGKSRFPMPPEGELRAAWTAYTRGAYAGAPQAESASYQAFRAYYAATASQAGHYDGAFNGDIADEATHAVTGGVADIGTAEIVLPYGMSEERTRDALAADWEAARKANGLPDSWALDGLGLSTIGNGLYQVSRGTGPVRDREGRVLTLRVKTPRHLAGRAP